MESAPQRLNGLSRISLTGMIACGLMASSVSGFAADVFKADNTDNLNLGSSWTGGVPPTAADVAVWDATVLGANPVQLGADTNWSGIRIAGAGGGMTIGVNAAALTVTASNPTLTYTTPPVNPLVNGDRVFLTGTAPGGLANFTYYFVVNATPTTFQVSATAGGNAITPTTAGANVTATGGATLTLGMSGVDTTTAAFPLVLASPVVIGATQDWNLLTGVTVSGGLSGNNDLNLLAGTLTVAGIGTTLSNIVVNAGAIVQANAGGVGVVSLNGGTYVVNAAVNQTLHVGSAGGTERNTGGNRTWSGVLLGDGPLAVEAASTHTWTGNHSAYTGILTLRGTGALRLSSVNSVSAGTAYVFENGTMNQNAAGIFNLGALSGTGNIGTGAGRDFSIGALHQDTTYSGNFTGAGRVIKVGTGTLTLDGTITVNTYTGSTVISNGVLQIGSGGASGLLGSGPVTNLSRLVFNIGGSQTFANLVTGPGSVTNVGTGAVTLTGANDYTGGTVITAGSLIVGNAAPASGNYTVENGAGLGAAVTSPGVTLSKANVTFTAGGSYLFDLRASGNPAVSVVSIPGNIALNGNVTVNVTGTNLAVGTVTLLEYTSRTGSGSFVQGTLPPLVTGTVIDDTANKRVLLNITSVTGVVDTSLKYVGDASGVWDIDNLANQIWKVAGTGAITNYYDGAATVFDDTATGTTNIDVAAVVSPAGVLVNVTNKIYTFGGFGSLSGTMDLVKRGPGLLIVTNANTYAGLTRIEAGSIKVAGETASLGTGGVTNNGSLTLDITTATNVVPHMMQFFGQLTGSGSLTVLGADPTNSIVEMQIGPVPGGNPGNPYTGGTTLSNVLVRLNANPADNATRSAAKSSGLGTGPITFLGESVLELEDYGVANDGAVAGVFSAPLNVPAGQIGELRTAGRMGVNSALTGSGTFNLVVTYVRDDITGDLSAFTGQMNVRPFDASDDFRVFNPLGLPQARLHLAAGVTLQSLAAGNSVIPLGELSSETNSGIGFANNVTWRIGGLNTDSTVEGNISSGTLSLIKEGTGTLSLAGLADYGGSTTISNGVLALIGETGLSNSVNVAIAAPGILNVSGRTDGTYWFGQATAQTLRGNGTLLGSLSVGSLGTVAPGFGVGTLTVTNVVVLGGATVMELNRAGSPNSDRIVAPSIAGGGSLTVTNIGGALQAGDTFQLFSTPVAGFSAINLPTNDTVNQVNYTWTDKLAIDGTIVVQSAVGSVNTNPTNITFQVSGGQLSLSWPESHIGWQLQAQTNALSVGLNTNWFDVAGSTATNKHEAPINPQNGAVFYRLVYP